MEAVLKVEIFLELLEEKGSDEKKAPGKELVIHNTPTPTHTHTPPKVHG